MYVFKSIEESQYLVVVCWETNVVEDKKLASANDLRVSSETFRYDEAKRVVGCDSATR